MNVFLKNLISGFFITLLFILITPGVLLTLPDKPTSGPGSFETNVIITHAAVFYFLYFIVKIFIWVVTKALKPRTVVGANTPVTSSNASSPARSSTAPSPSPPSSSPAKSSSPARSPSVVSSPSTIAKRLR